MLKDMLDWIGSLNRRGEMTAGELAEALMRYGADRPVEVRATPFLPKGTVEVSASSPTGDPGDAEYRMACLETDGTQCPPAIIPHRKSTCHSDAARGASTASMSSCWVWKPHFS